MSSANILNELQTIGSFTLINAVALGNKISTTVTSRLPSSITSSLSTVFSAVKNIVVDRTDAKIGLALLSFPLVSIVAITSLAGLALLWPLSFVFGLEALLVALPWYLFHPDRSSVRTIVFSAIFALGTQFIAVLPLYFLAPFAFTAAMVGLTVYLGMNRRWLYAPLSAWWVVTSPYWMAFHFLGFPVVFLASIGFQLASVAALCVMVYMWPQFPNDVMKHYAKYRAYVENKAAGATSTSTQQPAAKSTNQSTANYSTTKQSTNSTTAPVDWDKLTEKHSSYRNAAMKEEHKEITV